MICNSCQLDYEFEYNAIDYAVSEYGFDANYPKKVFVHNFQTNTSKLFVVTLTPAEPGFPQQTLAFESELQDFEIAQLDSIYTEMSILEDTLALQTEIDPSIADSAYDLIGQSYIWNQVLDNYKEQRSILRTAGDVITSLLSISSKLTGAKFTGTACFQDGSYIEFEISFEVSTSELTHVDLEVTKLADADGNELRYDSQGNVVISQGVYAFINSGEDTLSSFIAGLLRLGFSISSDIPDSYNGETKIECPTPNSCTVLLQ